MKKRVVVIADTHCGHKFGLTPPSWWEAEEPEEQEQHTKQRKFQRALWEFYSGEIERLKPIHLLIVNGDAIEGKGDKTGGRELITSDRHEQIRMAKHVIDLAEATKVRLLYGTAYHTGKDEDFESMLKDTIECDDTTISGSLFVEVNGVNFHVKHKIARSSIPHGRATPLMRAKLWNSLWAERGRQPKADVIIRSHVHYYLKIEDDISTMLITPALQYNTIYGIRECENVVNLGMYYFDVEDDGSFMSRPILWDSEVLEVRAESI